MQLSPTRSRTPLVLFAAFALAVYAAAFLVGPHLAGLRAPGAVASGLTLDLVLTVPAVFFLGVARRRGWPVVTAVPLVVLGLVLAARVLPADQHGTLRVLERLAAPLELGVIAWIALRARRALRRTSADDPDPLERLHAVAREVLGSERVAAFVASELALLHYAFAWRARPHVPAGTRAFTHHRKCGHGATVAVLLLLLAAEGFALHLLVTRWSPLAAWILSASELYAALWLIADHRATVLRPILVSDDALWLRAGLRASVRVPRAAIVAVTRTKPAAGALKLAFLASPTRWIRLAEPVVVRGPYGLARRTAEIGLAPDEPAALEASLAAPPPRDG